MKSRRSIMKQLAAFPLAISPALLHSAVPDLPQEEEINIVGPRNGYSAQIGTLVSMMNWMRNTILYPVQGMSIRELDYLHDEKSNSIGAMLWHLAATEKLYQENTFHGRTWDEGVSKTDKAWIMAMNLGDEARQKVKGNPLDFYLEKLQTVRDTTLIELKKRDDDWLLKVDDSWPWGPTNNYCKWFHVVEHESNHNGQIKWIKGRLPV
ncbi:MAG: DinB family protein [Saprospiraceae bacterium]|nr:DinB family protein [Saprospiraceae bacterium]